MATRLTNPYKYNDVDNELNEINSKYISLNGNQKKVTTAFFNQFMPSFVNEMKKVDKFFERTFQSILYAGSYYEGLKVGRPDEYDLDLIFKLPINYDKLEITSSPNKPGYVKLQISDLEYRRLLRNQHWIECYKVMANWFDGKYFFIPDKFRFWLQSVVQKTLNQYKFPNALKVYYTTSGPAITLHIEEYDSYIKFSVDLVPVLQIQNRCPPSSIFNISEVERSVGRVLSWYVVPKPVKNAYNNINGSNLNWRLAFHEHEKVLISRNERLKPALRLLKKFRDSRNFSKIASYYLKTICLWELKKPENAGLWTYNSLSYVFVHLLKAFYESLRVGEIQYYWQKENNLLSDLNKSTIDDMCNTLKRIIDKIELDPKCIPSYILSREEYEEYKYKLNKPDGFDHITSTISESQTNTENHRYLLWGLGIGVALSIPLILLRNRNRST